MTGFARSHGQANCGRASGKWNWEVRSVNARTLDMRLRLPQGFEYLEPACRKEIGIRFSRGNVQATLTFLRDISESVPVVNQAALDSVLAALAELQAKIGAPPPAAEAVLAIRGVIEYGEDTAEPEEIEARDNSVLAGLSTALSDLSAARLSEGSAIEPFLAEQVDRISHLAGQIRDDPSRTPQALRDRLAALLAPLLEDNYELDAQRLHQEAAILATKADLSEEIDRLTAHIESARNILGSGGPVGRKLDFLAQELNRECNTICSKSNAAAVTAAGLEMKVVIDRFREQVQNLE